MWGQSVTWLAVVVVVTALQTQTCYGIQKASSRLNVTVEGSVLTWWLYWDQTSDLIQYSVAVYTSTAPESEIVSVSERTTDTSFDLDSLALQEGTYYIQVQAFVGMENNIFGEIAVYNVSTQGRTSEGSSLTTLLVTISCVLTAAMVVGSVLFAVTMWRVRAHGRQHASNAGSKAKRIFMTILCPCRRRAASCSTAQTGRDGLQLSTIQARDKNKQLIALHLARHVQNARRVDEGTRLNKPSQPSAKRRRTDDLPYGYVSPADINIPQFRRENKFSASEGGPQPQTHQKAANELKYTASEGGISQLVREKSTDEIISQSESLYSTPCSLTSSMEEYENTQNYLTILPP